MDRKAIADGLVAGTVAAVLSGAPSTLWALITGADWLEAARAAGNLLLSANASPSALLIAGAFAHVSISLFWGIVLGAALPRRNTVLAGALAGVAIAALDLGLIGRYFPLIEALPLLPQLADHVAFGAVAGFVIARRRGLRPG
jgi:hypothetical protein